MGRLVGLETLAPLLAIAAIGFAAFSQSAARSVRHRVDMSGIGYHPDQLEVTVGDTVVWINHDLVPHTATAVGASGWDTGSIAVEDSAQVIPRHKGTFGYACSFHPTMKATLTVK